MKKIEGIVPAVFTPMKKDGSINLDQIPNFVEQLIKDGVSAFYICGSTGEGFSLTTDERMAVAKTYVESVKKRLPIIINVGHDSIKEAQKLTEIAEQIGADAFSAVPPSYFQISSLDNLLECMAEITSAAPKLPFYYYHIPRLTSVEVDMIEFLNVAKEKIQNLVGVKYSDFKLFELQSCLEFENGNYDILFGCDEMLLSALTIGVKGAVGSTYNYATPLYNKIIHSFKNGKIKDAREWQSLSVEMVKLQYKYGGIAAFKATMKMIGVDCGPIRLPLQTLTQETMNRMEKELEKIGFFDWGRS